MNWKKENIVIISLCIILLFLGFEAGGFQWAIGHMAQEYHLGPHLAGMLVSGKYAVMIIAPLLSGIISDYIGKKPALIFGMLCFAAGCFFMNVLSISGVIAASILIGLGYSFTECTATAIMAELPGGKKSVNYSQCAFCIGAVLSPVVMENYGCHWSVSFLIPGIMFLIFVFPLIKYYNCVKKIKTEAKKRIPVFSRDIPILMCVMLLYGMIENGSVYSFMDLFSLNLKVSYGAYAISSFWLAMATGRILFTLTKTDKMKTGMYYGIIFFILLYLGFGKNGVVALIMAFCLGLFCAPLWPGLMLIAAEKNPVYAGTAIGCMSIAASIGGTISPTLLGLSEKYIGYAAPFQVLAVIAFLGIINSFVIRMLDLRRSKEDLSCKKK